MSDTNEPLKLAEPIDLDAIERRANAATPGPWLHGSAYEDDTWLRDASGRAVVGAEYGYRLCFESEDAAFIAAARTDVPALVAEVRYLRAMAKAYQDTALVRADEIARLRQALAEERAACVAILRSSEPNTRAEQIVDKLHAVVDDCPPHVAGLIAELCTATADELAELAALVEKRGATDGLPVARAHAAATGRDSFESAKLTTGEFNEP